MSAYYFNYPSVDLIFLLLLLDSVITALVWLCAWTQENGLWNCIGANQIVNEYLSSLVCSVSTHSVSAQLDSLHERISWGQNVNASRLESQFRCHWFVLSRLSSSRVGADRNKRTASKSFRLAARGVLEPRRVPLHEWFSSGVAWCAKCISA